MGPVQAPIRKRVNLTLLGWCIIVIVEFFVLASLLHFPLIILCCLVLYSPIRESLSWREYGPPPQQSTITDPPSPPPTPTPPPTGA